VSAEDGPDQASASYVLADHVTPERLGAFSDGVAAIAATLLTLEIRIPGAEESVWASIRSEWPILTSYVISFLVIGIAWIHHPNLFHLVRHVTRPVLLLNLGLLMSLSLLPVPTAVLGNHLRGRGGTPGRCAVLRCARRRVAVVPDSLALPGCPPAPAGARDSLPGAAGRPPGGSRAVEVRRGRGRGPVLTDRRAGDRGSDRPVLHVRPLVAGVPDPKIEA
jgi:Endosomal/lysosomal potassium channel TMEM175